jgi:hypothetical protein
MLRPKKYARPMEQGSGGGSATLTDDDIRERGVIGPIELKLRARWARVEDALGDVRHESVLYHWRDDSTGKPAMFIEVPLTQDVPVEKLLDYQDAVRRAVEGFTDRTVYVHFVGAGDATDDDLSA